MGLFDSVIAKCPCDKEERLEFQSKAGKCELIEYNLNSVPVAIASEFNEYFASETKKCSCGKEFTITSPYLCKQIPMIILEV